MSDGHISIIFSLVLSLILSLAKIARDSKITTFQSYYTFHFALFFFIFSVGNVVTTLVAQSIIENNILTKDPNSIALKGPLWIWYTFIGVFGFEFLIQKINVTFLDHGLLSINDWIKDAKANAVAATLEKTAEGLASEEIKLALELHQQLAHDHGKLHTIVRHIIGEKLYSNALLEIQGQPNISIELALANVAASVDKLKVRAVLKSKQQKKPDSST
ncbi:hypothetical protein [Chryseolinea lacunae]|uniref:DUF2254 domain-containing protein n=1 Tax=Chryseolinea lacunae TaxID=2801331 RepID=A0ABS1KSR5_9BACT|nr:hypothetical protein [Chryseolinea lacunae]MBL0742307.1 hypothetical protein [Chryseolinea lacunae]